MTLVAAAVLAASVTFGAGPEATQAADRPMEAQIDSAGGAYVMSGTAAKKDKK